MVSSSIRWSVYVGIYTFLAGVGLLIPLWVIARTVVEILGAPPSFAVILVPGSSAVIGAVVWGAIVEQRNTYTYLLGITGGLVTGVLTVLCWTLVVAAVWGLEAVLAARIVILFVLTVVGLVASIAWVPLIYARCQ
ncbi:hypothetical protein [Halalkaliarchaeum desulfuricum]|uniref:hypothetical protein n=1 Tax=Halalkaliarchaeum desulfuricum TaxID=2055893 RepID=UPI000E6C0754|nr:hypothetical protein [Halalkaliarchaeum desulfuricum]